MCWQSYDGATCSKTTEHLNNTPESNLNPTGDCEPPTLLIPPASEVDRLIATETPPGLPPIRLSNWRPELPDCYTRINRRDICDGEFLISSTRPDSVSHWELIFPQAGGSQKPTRRWWQRGMVVTILIRDLQESARAAFLTYALLTLKGLRQRCTRYATGYDILG